MANRVWVDDRALTRYFAGFVKRANDFGPVFRWMRKELREAFTENFLSGGGLVGRWAPLDAEYGAWKAAHYGPLPKLVLSGSLFRAVRSLRGPLTHIGPKSADFGVSHPIAKFHQYGTYKMPRRPIVFVPRDFAFRSAERTGEYLVYGGGASGVWRRLKGLFKE